VSRAALYSLGPYVALSAAIALAAAALDKYLGAVQDNGFAVLRHPFAAPFWGAALLFAFYLAIISARPIARERAPGRFLALMSLYALLLVVYLAVLGLYAWLVNLALPLTLLWDVLLSLSIASAAVALGGRLSTLARPLRGALLALLAVAVAWLGLRLSQRQPCAYQRPGYQLWLQEMRFRPLCSDDPQDVIYARQDSVLYLRPYEPGEAEAHSCQRTWLCGQPLDGVGNLGLDFEGIIVETLAQSYHLQPLPGPMVAYRLADGAAADGTSPDLVAYPLFVDANHAHYSLSGRGRSDRALQPARGAPRARHQRRGALLCGRTAADGGRWPAGRSPRTAGRRPSRELGASGKVAGLTLGVTVLWYNKAKGKGGVG